MMRNVGRRKYMNDLSVNISVVVVLVSMILSLGVLIYGMIKFKKKYLIVLLLTLVVWPFIESGMERITSNKVVKAIREDGSASAGSIQLTGMVSRELIRSLLVLSSAILIFLNEKKANHPSKVVRQRKN